MPLTRIICPHCEQAVEVSMTSVTRSRDCPLCGRTIMLQFTTQEKRQRRKALLTPAVNTDAEVEEDSAPPPGLAVTPRPIQGDLRERMMLDPEVRQRVRVIKISVVIITAIIAVVVLGSMFHWWTGIANVTTQLVKQYNASRLSSADDSDVAPKTDHRTVDGDGRSTTPENATTPFKQAETPQEDAAVLKVVTEFLHATNVDKRLSLSLGQKTAEPRMRAYYKKHPDAPIPYETIESLGAESTDNTALDFVVTLKDGTPRRLVARKSQAKGYLIDWPSFVVYSDMEWNEFMSTRPHDPLLFRVMASSAEVYRNEFDGPSKYICLKLSNPLDMKASPVYAYAFRSSSLGHGLEFVMRRAAGATVPMILKLKYPTSANGASDQVWVHEFVGEGWVTRTW